jgi:hypothetical protein
MWIKTEFQDLVNLDRMEKISLMPSGGGRYHLIAEDPHGKKVLLFIRDSEEECQDLLDQLADQLKASTQLTPSDIETPTFEP